MAFSNKRTDKEPSGGGVFAKVLDVLVGFRMFFIELKEAIMERGDWVLRRLVYIFVIYLWISAGVLLMILGVFDLLVEFGRVPRGVVFSVGGLLVLLVAVILLQAAKAMKRKK